MSIQDQIAAAWIHKYGRESLKGIQWGMFREGYLASLRDLFVEVKPEDCRPGEIYTIVCDRGEFEATYHRRLNFRQNSPNYGKPTGKWYFDVHALDEIFDAEEIQTVWRTNIPSPSDLFTEIL